MRAGLVLGALLLATACVAVPIPARAPSAPDDASLGTTTRLMVEETNRIRVAEGLRPLAVHSQLAAAAQLQAEQMARYGVMAHEIPRAPYPTLKSRLAIAGYDYADAAENLAKGFGTGTSVVTGWMRSPSHRVNILDPVFTELGTGYVVDGAGNKYYAQVFGKRR